MKGGVTGAAEATTTLASTVVWSASDVASYRVYRALQPLRWVRVAAPCARRYALVTRLRAGIPGLHPAGALDVSLCGVCGGVCGVLGCWRVMSCVRCGVWGVSCAECCGLVSAVALAR